MNVYLAARYSRKHEMREARTSLESLGYYVTSRWLDEPDEHTYESAPAHVLHGHALDDWEDILDADAVLFFAGLGRRGGSMVEFGIALANDTPICVIGGIDNIYHHLDERSGVWHADDLDDAIGWLQGAHEWLWEENLAMRV